MPSAGPDHFQHHRPVRAWSSMWATGIAVFLWILDSRRSRLAALSQPEGSLASDRRSAPLRSIPTCSPMPRNCNTRLSATRRNERGNHETGRRRHSINDDVRRTGHGPQTGPPSDPWPPNRYLPRSAEFARSVAAVPGWAMNIGLPQCKRALATAEDKGLSGTSECLQRMGEAPTARRRGIRLATSQGTVSQNDRPIPPNLHSG